MLITLVRRLIALEAARMLRPNCPRIGSEYASAWLAAVRANRGDSSGLERISRYAALARIQRLAVGLTLQAAANATRPDSRPCMRPPSWPADPALDASTEEQRNAAWGLIDDSWLPPRVPGRIWDPGCATVRPGAL